MAGLEAFELNGGWFVRREIVDFREVYYYAGRPIFLLFYTAVLLNGPNAFAATVAGEVYDLRTGEVLAGVKVAVEESKAESARDGSYRLYEVEPGRRLLTAKKKGYALLYDDNLIVGETDETWVNLGMLSLEPDSEKVKGDFLDLMSSRAPGAFGEEPISADLYKLPVRVSIDRRGGFISEDHARDLIEVLNKKLGGLYYTLVEDDGPWDVKFIFIGREEGEPILVENAGGVWYAIEPVRDTFFYIDATNAGPGNPVAGPGNVAVMRDVEPGEFYRTAGAFLRYMLLAGRRAGPRAVERAELDDDIDIGTDLDAVLRITYEAGPVGHLGKYRCSKKGRAAVLAGFTVGWGDAVRPGLTNAKGEDLTFPTNYTLGYLTLDGGITLGAVVAGGGLWHLAIWGENVEEEAPTTEYVVFKEIRQVESFWGFGGYRWDAVDGSLSITPYGGYRYLELEGYFHGERNAPGRETRWPGRETRWPGDPPDIIIEGVRSLDGPEVGTKVVWITGIGDLALYLDYAEFFGGGPSVHVAEGGVGAARWRGVGIYAFWRQFWNGTLDYRCGGLGFQGEFGF